MALLTTLLSSRLCAAEKRVLVVYSGDGKAAYTAQWVVPALLNLLGHFECAATAVSASAYRAGQVGASDATIYLGLGATADLPAALLADIYDSDKPICWLGGDISQLGSRFSLGRYGFRVDLLTAADQYSRVLYQAQVLKRPRAPLSRITATDRVSCQVLATVEGGPASLPYAVRSGRFWYFADIPLLETDQNGSYLVLADQLHEILNQRHSARRTALIVIAGVSAQTDPGALRGLAGYLQSEKLPYAIAVTPVFREPARHSSVPLSSRRSVVGVIRGAQRAGAAIIDSGLTHQYQGRSDDDAEFWDIAGNRPPLGRTPADTTKRISDAVAELGRCGLYPIVWSTPLGRASSSDYIEIARSCGATWERRLTSALAPAPQTFPYLIKRDSFGQQVIPDNLSPLHSSDEAETILEQARSQTVVPDPWLTLVLAPEAPIDSVRLLVSALQEMGFGFADLRRTAQWMKGKSLEIHSCGEPTALTKLIPAGWDATVLGPEKRDLKRYEDDGSDEREITELRPGALLIAYPKGDRPHEIFALEGGPEELAQRAVTAIARAVVAFAAVACIVFIIIYVIQISLLRRA